MVLIPAASRFMDGAKSIHITGQVAVTHRLVSILWQCLCPALQNLLICLSTPVIFTFFLCSRGEGKKRIEQERKRHGKSCKKMMQNLKFYVTDLLGDFFPVGIVGTLFEFFE
jgi:hypothetical protein